MSIILVCLLCLPVFCWECVNKFKTPVWGHTETPGGECHRHRTWVKEKTKRFGCIYSNWGFWHGCWQMCRWTAVLLVHMCSGFPTRRSKQMIMTSSNDVTRISHATLGGNYKKDSALEPWGCHLGLLCHTVWVLLYILLIAAQWTAYCEIRLLSSMVPTCWHAQLYIAK